MRPRSPYTPVCLVGPGAVGLFLATILSPHTPTWLLCKESQLESLKNSTLQVSGARSLSAAPGSFSLISPHSLRSLPEEIVFVITVKAFDLENVLTQIGGALNRNRPCLILSNGLTIYDSFRSQIGADVPLLRGCSYFGVQKISDNSVVLAGDGRLELAADSRYQKILTMLLSLFSQSTLACSTSSDPHAAEWRKALVNLVVNPLASILKVENGYLLQSSELKKLCQELLTEVRLVAEAERITLSSPNDEEFFLDLKRYARNYNSQLCDLLADRRTENEFLLGRFLEIARRQGIETPRLRTMYTLCRALEALARQH